MELNKYIDHTILKRDAVYADIDKVINEAIEYKFKTVCTHPIWTGYLAEKLNGTGIDVTIVIGFPYGVQTTETKVFEAKDALSKGANELDFVIAVSMVHERNTEYLEKELKSIREATKGHTIKLILETGLLSKEEIEYATELGVQAGFDFIKTSTGIETSGATLEDVQLIAKVINGRAQIKASGGVRSFEDAKTYIDAGATRIGTSNGTLIMDGKIATKGY